MTDDDNTRTPGRAAQIVRGVSRFLVERGESCLTEFTLKTGHRVDVIALDRKGRITVVKGKSSQGRGPAQGMDGSMRQLGFNKGSDAILGAQVAEKLNVFEVPKLK